MVMLVMVGNQTKVVIIMKFFACTTTAGKITRAANLVIRRHLGLVTIAVTRSTISVLTLMYWHSLERNSTPEEDLWLAEASKPDLAVWSRTAGYQTQPARGP